MQALRVWQGPWWVLEGLAHSGEPYKPPRFDVLSQYRRLCHVKAGA